METSATGGAAPGPSGPPEPKEPAWRFVLQPKWLLWHLTMVVAFWGMLWLGDWQFHRAIGGNGLSWAYTFEWPLFAVFGIVFWARTIRDEFRARRGIDQVIEHGYATDLPDGVGRQQLGSLPEDDEEDEELASYNAYLAKLNARANSRAKAIAAGRKAIANG